MFFLVLINHPAHYHLFKNFRREMLMKGHEVVFIIKEKDILSQLLKSECVEYTQLISNQKPKNNSSVSIIKSHFVELIKCDYELYKYIKKNRPDFLLGTDVSIAHISAVTKVPSFVFNEDDIDVNKLFCYSSYPFTKYIISPRVCNVGKYGYKKINYDGYQKLAYLHPNRFTPNGDLIRHPFNKAANNFIIRMVSFTACHDIEQKHSGIDEPTLDIIIDKLKSKGIIHITSEKPIPEKYSKYKLDIKINDIHNYLSVANLFISDSQSMTVESCMLGTPSLRYNSFAGKISVLNELENKYELTSSYCPTEKDLFLNKLEELVNTPDLKLVYQARRKRMLKDKIDFTAFLIWLFEYYPCSIKELNNNPEIQYQFK